MSLSIDLYCADGSPMGLLTWGWQTKHSCFGASLSEVHRGHSVIHRLSVIKHFWGEYFTRVISCAGKLYQYFGLLFFYNQVGEKVLANLRRLLAVYGPIPYHPARCCSSLDKLYHPKSGNSLTNHRGLSVGYVQPEIVPPPNFIFGAYSWVNGERTLPIYQSSHVRDFCFGMHVVSCEKEKSYSGYADSLSLETRSEPYPAIGLLLQLIIQLFRGIKKSAAYFEFPGSVTVYDNTDSGICQ